jgi:magnesium-transporting ATPase (P-type)
MMQQIGHDYVGMREQLLPKKDLIRFPFDSTRKRMTTMVEYKDNIPTETGYFRRMHTKGAAEKILETCSHYLDSNGEKQPIDDVTQKKLLAEIDKLAVQALRAIAFAYKDLTDGQNGKDHKDLETGQKVYEVEKFDNTLICIAGIKDIIRPEVPTAVKKCKNAGVRVRMVTGD